MAQKFSENIQVLSKIRDYCSQIETTKCRFGNNYYNFVNDDDYQKSISMSLLQIGELTTHLTDDYINLTKNIVDWRSCKRFRNIVAHRYHTVSFETVWKIANDEIPVMKHFCNEQIIEMTADILKQTVDKNSNTFGTDTEFVLSSLYNSGLDTYCIALTSAAVLSYFGQNDNLSETNKQWAFGVVKENGITWDTCRKAAADYKPIDAYRLGEVVSVLRSRLGEGDNQTQAIKNKNPKR